MGNMNFELTSSNISTKVVTIISHILQGSRATNGRQRQQYVLLQRNYRTPLIDERYVTMNGNPYLKIKINTESYIAENAPP